MSLSIILCPIDFSATTAAVVTYAAALAAGTGAELRLLHVEEAQPSLVASPASPDLLVARRLAEQREAALRTGAHVSTLVLRGEAAAEILAAAQRLPADLIVLGAHGQTGLTRFLMGHTAETVVRTAPCATLLVTPSVPAAYRQSA